MDPLSLGLTPAQLSMESNFRSSAPGSDVVSLFHEHHLAVYHYLLRMLGARPEAEDITQEAFLRLDTQLSEGATIGNARNWLFRVAHNLAIDCMRQNRIGEQGCFVPFDAGHDVAVAVRKAPNGECSLTPLNENTNAQFRVEFFNVLNHVTLGPPNATIGNLAAGSITQARYPRSITCGLRCVF